MGREILNITSSILNSCSGHRIVAVAAPGMASGNTFESKPKTFEEPVFAEGFEAVLRASGRVAATWRQHGRDEFLIHADQKNKRQAEVVKQFFHTAFFGTSTSSFCNNFSIFCSSNV